MSRFVTRFSHFIGKVFIWLANVRKSAPWLTKCKLGSHDIFISMYDIRSWLIRDDPVSKDTPFLRNKEWICAICSRQNLWKPHRIQLHVTLKPNKGPLPSGNDHLFCETVKRNDEKQIKITLVIRESNMDDEQMKLKKTYLSILRWNSSDPFWATELALRFFWFQSDIS